MLLQISIITNQHTKPPSQIYLKKIKEKKECFDTLKYYSVPFSSKYHYHLFRRLKKTTSYATLVLKCPISDMLVILLLPCLRYATLAYFTEHFFFQNLFWPLSFSIFSFLPLNCFRLPFFHIFSKSHFGSILFLHVSKNSWDTLQANLASSSTEKSGVDYTRFLAFCRSR